MSLVRRMRLSPGRGLRRLGIASHVPRTISAIRLEILSISRRRCSCPSIGHRRCLNKMHNVTAPINPCAEPDWRLREDLGFVSPKCSPPLRSSAAVIARESGRSSNRQTIITGCPAFAGHDRLVAIVVDAHRCFVEPSSIVPGERAPGRRWGMSPHPRGAKRRQALVRNAAPGGRLTAKPVPSAEGNSRPITRTGAPIGASPRRFSFDLGTAFWKRTGAPIRTPLIPRGFPRFHPLHQPVAGRTHVVGPGGVSRGPRRPGWLGRTLRRRIPPRSHAPHENALGRVGRRYRTPSKRTNQEQKDKILGISRGSEMTPQNLQRRARHAYYLPASAARMTS